MQETQETWVWSLGQEDPLEEEMATHSSSLALEIPWTGEPGRLQSTGLQRVGKTEATEHRMSFRYYTDQWPVQVDGKNVQGTRMIFFAWKCKPSAVEYENIPFVN